MQQKPKNNNTQPKNKFTKKNGDFGHKDNRAPDSNVPAAQIPAKSKPFASNTNSNTPTGVKNKPTQNSGKFNKRTTYSHKQTQSTTAPGAGGVFSKKPTFTNKSHGGANMGGGDKFFAKPNTKPKVVITPVKPRPTRAPTAALRPRVFKTFLWYCCTRTTPKKIRRSRIFKRSSKRKNQLRTTKSLRLSRKTRFNLNLIKLDLKRVFMEKARIGRPAIAIQRLRASSTYWGLRMLAFRPIRKAHYAPARVHFYKLFSSTLHTGKSRVSHFTPHIYDINNAPQITRNNMWIFFRMRFERFMFKALGCRVYCWFSNLWNAMRGDLTKWKMFEHFAILRLIKKGMRFTIRENHARVFLKSAVLAVSVVGGLSVFMQMLSRMVQTFRSHWAVVMYSLRLFDNCRCFFWYKVLVQYRMVVRGKFGGQMRAGQKHFEHGMVKLGAWSLDVGYYRIRPVTKYGTFSLRFWLQFRDIRETRMINMLTYKGRLDKRESVYNEHFNV